ncbi:MAG: sulfur carrier protein ThiS adenylyltransferase ThiF [Lachnospiraceae bacterium]|nr:sulfur carrier protein ThiS adenylyltransferase ThiF [Lachnospiraceae bacterium]
MIPSKEEMYQALVERHGEVLQEKFQNGKVAVLGLGGLGSNIAIALARAGVGSLHLIDFDKVDITNLNRQQYFVHQLGTYKTEALSETLKQIAPYCQVKITTMKVTKNDIKELLKEEDIICEAFDQAEAKAMLVEGVLEEFPEKYVISGSGMAGISSANTIKTRKVLSHLYLCGDEVSDIKDGLGLFSSRVMVCAAQEANMALRILAGELEP